jgi:succinate dehydrogenase/fumarate reductase flavoprotein subunit
MDRHLSLKAGRNSYRIPLSRVHTLVLGSGAAGLNAAVQLHINGVKDLMIVSEGLLMGTSINTGSDKQTYYRLSMYGSQADSPRDMAQTYFDCGSMHGDLALVESSLSLQGFINLVNLGVPFPRDEYGQFVGYKTDHDPRRRATSIGPYTSRKMCLTLIDRIRELGIRIREGLEAVELVTAGGESPRAAGLLCVDRDGHFEAFICENLVFAVGGPGGLYKASVYPVQQSGAIGLALMAGACAANLPESQFGLASTAFRWNVSGSYMQVIPRVISRSSNSHSDEKEFLPPYFPSPAAMHGTVFLKGYQWPFDARKAIDGSSLIDILVYIETVVKGRRVFLDFRANPTGYSLFDLPDEARAYLEKSGAVQDTPIGRLLHMNPGAANLYKNHDIDLSQEPLEVAVCAQHNNGGLAGNIWYESTNIKHLFPVGEVNGSHGVTRPGGAALNAGQVAGFRAAEFIANRYGEWSLDDDEAAQAVKECAQGVIDYAELCLKARNTWESELEQVRERLSRSGAHIRSLKSLDRECPQAREQVRRLMQSGCAVESREQIGHAFRVRQLAFAQAAYLDAIRYALQSGAGSRGSSIVLDPGGTKIHDMLDDSWRIAAEDTSFRSKVIETLCDRKGEANHSWVDCRPIPETDAWFETTWARFRSGDIYFR